MSKIEGLDNIKIYDATSSLALKYNLLCMFFSLPDHLKKKKMSFKRFIMRCNIIYMFKLCTCGTMLGTYSTNDTWTSIYVMQGFFNFMFLELMLYWKLFWIYLCILCLLIIIYTSIYQLIISSNQNASGVYQVMSFFNISVPIVF